ncbi:glucosamine inositolphosphorylceramide transferase family protein [Rhodopila globiformis]|uniref:Glucosamine inositolphosphorylceramide transferase 1 N-terminal domain-containing protein n=1 Tax=Rhodopila globiformis TaxID=1071 RepID=A0A2S6MTT1_RHOGL|nr:hypothetical protein [Rhodopila globiformis]PPQ25762.1 hypothetical protein CCS01_31820 [Rhodopila globiformis]
MVVVLAGIDTSEIVDAALTDTALCEAVVLRLEPGCSAPCDALLWRLETANGDSLDHAALLHRYWHRRPYALTVRLVQYASGSATPDVLDEGTIGTRGSRAAFLAAVDRLAMRFVRDAALGRARGPACVPPVPRAHGLPGWLDHLGQRWHSRFMTEWWSLGSTSVPMQAVFDGSGLKDIRWYAPAPGRSYLADPFPWPGTNRILCEDMPTSEGVGRIIAVSQSGVGLSEQAVILDDGHHHSYPCTFLEGDTVYCVPEAPQRGATRIHRLADDGSLAPVCDVAPHSRLADPTLFRWNGRYWLGCTDLDLGEHDNLCLLHAEALTGPWVPHARWPVKIDVRGARCAGMLFDVNGRLFRPGQDCAATYGAAVAVHEILALSETEFQEALVTVLRPDKAGPFPHGLHTLTHDGEQFWVDGKRYVLDRGALLHKLAARASRLLFRARLG